MLKILTTPADLDRALPVLQELRPHVSREELGATYAAARAADGYELVALEADGALVALMGYRVLQDFVHGRHLYVDDLVVTEKSRSKGLGVVLLKHAEERARALGCKGLRLCTGVDNAAGIRFYEREGWKARALAFKKTC